VRDASSAYGDEQKSQVEKVLGELEVLDKPRIEVLNKIDLLTPEERAGLGTRGIVRFQPKPARESKDFSMRSTKRSPPIRWSTQN